MISKSRDLAGRVVPELVKKKAARDAEQGTKLVEERKKKKEEHKLKLKEYIARGQKWYTEDLKAKKELVELKRQAKREGNYYVPAEAKVAFVIRIKGY